MNVSIMVPKGSVLFSVYINDFPRASQILKTLLITDDGVFSITNSDYISMISILNEELDRVP